MSHIRRWMILLLPSLSSSVWVKICQVCHPSLCPITFCTTCLRTWGRWEVPLTVTSPLHPSWALLGNPPRSVSKYIWGSHCFILSLFLCRCVCSYLSWLGMVTWQKRSSQVGICAKVHKVCQLWASGARVISLTSACTASTTADSWSDATFEC